MPSHPPTFRPFTRLSNLTRTPFANPSGTISEFPSDRPQWLDPDSEFVRATGWAFEDLCTVSHQQLRQVCVCLLLSDEGPLGTLLTRIYTEVYGQPGELRDICYSPRSWRNLSDFSLDKYTLSVSCFEFGLDPSGTKFQLWERLQNFRHRGCLIVAIA